MQDQNIPNTNASTPAKPVRKKRRIWLIVLLVLVAAIVVVVALAPVWVSSTSGRSFIVNKVNQSMTGKVGIGGLSVGWFSGIDVADLSFSDPAAGMQVSVKHFSTVPHYMALLSGDVELGKTVIEKPTIELTTGGPSKTPQTPAPAKTPEAKKASAGGIPIKMLDLTITDGDIKITPAGSGARSVQFSNITAKVDIRPGDGKSDFNVAMNVQDGGEKADIKAAGSATGITKKGWRMTETTGDLNIEVKGLDLASLKELLDAAGVKMEAAGKLNANVTANIDNGDVKGIDVSVDGENLAIGGAVMKGDTVKTSKLKVVAKAATQGGMLDIKEAAITTDWLSVTATGSVPTKALSADDLLSPATNYTLKTNVTCNIAQILSQMPHIMGLKPGMQITGGKLTASAESATTEGKRFVSCSAAIEDVQGTMDGKPVALSAPVRLEAKIASDGKKPVLDKGTFSASFGSIDCKGPFDSLDYAAKLDLAALRSELSQFVDMGAYNFAGRFEGSGNVAMDKGNVATSGKASISDLVLSMKDKQVREAMITIDHDVKFDGGKKVLSLNTVALGADFGKVTVNKAEMTLGGAGSMQVPVSLQLDFKKLLPLAVAFGGVSKDMDLDGKLAAEITATQTGSIWHIVMQDATITDLAVTSPGQQPLSQKLVKASCDGTIDTKEQTYSFKKLSVVGEGLIKVDFSSLEKTTSGATSSMRGEMKAEYDLAAVTTLAAPYMPKGLVVKGARKQDVTFSSTWPTADSSKMLANLSGKTNLGFDEAHYKGMNMGQTNINVKFDKGFMTIEPFSTTLNKGTLSFAGTADFTKKPVFLVMPSAGPIITKVMIDDVIAQQLLEYLNPVFANATNVSGIASLSLKELKIPLSGAGKEAMVIVGNFDVDSLNLNGGSLLGQLVSLCGAKNGSLVGMKIYPTDFTLRDSVIRYNDMKLTIEGNPIDFGGSIGLDKALDMTVTLPFKASGQRVALALKGTVDKPALDTGKLLEQGLKSGLEEGFNQLLKSRK
jgi:hypothetical protein